MDLSVVIVSYNVQAFLDQCLVSVIRACTDLQYEILVVDNRSTDNTVDFVRNHYPEIQLIANDQNLGFSKANNIALARCRGKYVLILNPDTVLSEDTIKQCIAFVEEHADLGLVGVRMLDGAGRFLPESKRGLPSPVNSFFKMTGLNWLFPNSNLFNGYYQGGTKENETAEVPVVTGAFMFTRKRVIDEVGYFDEDYFMYGEDIDLSYRFLQAGYPNYYLPTTSIIHYKGESTKRSSIEYVKTFYKAMLIFVGKHYTGRGQHLRKQLLVAGIYARGLLSGSRQFIGKLLPLALDVLTIVLCLLLVKYLWATYYFGNPNHFESRLLTINFPIYVGVWVISLLLSGAYDGVRPPGKRVFSGMFLGTLVLLALYGLFDQSLRSSRMLIILGAGLATVGLLLLRSLVWTGQRRWRVAVVGTKNECIRLLEVVNRMPRDISYAAAITLKPELDCPNYAGQIADIEQIVREYRIDELIFSSTNLDFGLINKLMSSLGSQVKYQITGHKTNQLIGSASSKIAADLYTFEVGFAIDDPFHKRNKQLLAFLFALVYYVLLPLGVFSRKWKQLWGEVGDLVRKRKGLVGYNSPDPKLDELPPIPVGIFQVAGRPYHYADHDADIHLVNYLYAREFSVWKDVEAVLSAIFSKKQGR